MTHTQTHTHYCIAIMEGGALARGMYTRSIAYETADLARRLGPMDRHLTPGRPLALVRVETYDDTDREGRPCRSLLREMILDTLPGVSGETPTD